MTSLALAKNSSWRKTNNINLGVLKTDYHITLLTYVMWCSWKNYGSQSIVADDTAKYDSLKCSWMTYSAHKTIFDLIYSVFSYFLILTRLFPFSHQRKISASTRYALIFLWWFFLKHLSCIFSSRWNFWLKHDFESPKENQHFIQIIFLWWQGCLGYVCI